MANIMVDNTPSMYRFKDGNPLSDGMASFASSILNAGPAAAQVRQARERDSVAQAFQQAQGDRADRALDMQALWHQQSNDMDQAKAGVYAGEDPAMVDLARKVKLAGAQKSQVDQAQLERQDQQLGMQTALTKAQIANMQADNARQTLGQFGNGLNEAIKRGVDVAKLMTGRNGSAAQPRVFKARGDDLTERFYALDENGQMRELPMKQMAQPTTTDGAGAGTTGGAPSGTPTAQTPPTPISRVNLQRLPTAINRATKTLTQMSQRVASLTDEAERQTLLMQARTLADSINAANRGDKQAIQDLLEVDAAQPDTQEQEARDSQLNGAMMRVDEATPAMYR